MGEGGLLPLGVMNDHRSETGADAGVKALRPSGRGPSRSRATAGRQPAWVEPELATLTNDRFSDPSWLERKFDGERCLAYRAGDQVRLMTRNQKQVNGTYPELAAALLAEDCSDFIVDGEVVASRHHASAGGELLTAVPVSYYLFDVVWADGSISGRCRCDSANSAAPAAVVQRADPLRDAPHARRRGVFRPRLWPRLGGPGREARGRSLPVRPVAGLAEIQVPEQSGVRHRRLHRSQGLKNRIRRPSARLLRPRRQARICGGRSARFSTRPPWPNSPGPCRAWFANGLRSTAALCRGRACIGSSRASSLRWRSASGPERGNCAIRRFQGLRRDKDPASVRRRPHSAAGPQTGRVGCAELLLRPREPTTSNSRGSIPKSLQTTTDLDRQQNYHLLLWSVAAPVV